MLAGCAAPQYAVRQAPQPVETPGVVRIERAISAEQAKLFVRQGAFPLSSWESIEGLPPQDVLERLSRVTERPALPYRVHLYESRDPNAAALADGRVYLSTGMLAFLAQRSQAEDALAFVLAHELAHTVAQHLAKRYEAIQRQNLWVSLLGVGLSAATADAGQAARQLSELAVNAAALVRDVAISGYSQEQELEADQLGVQYVMRARYDPQAALTLLDDFQRFESPWPFLRTHPYTALRRDYLARYLAELGAVSAVHASAPSPPAEDPDTQARIRHLRRVQQLYPRDSISWQNLQRQIDELEK